MFFVKDSFKDTLEVKKSKFIAFLVPFNQFKSKLEELKKEHLKARHFVYAYRYLDNNIIVENSSDDNEPKGSAGKPSLKVLQGKDIINSAVIIVRYFGGIKLGVGGLVRAYSKSVNLVLEKANLFEYRFLETKKIKVPYEEFSKLEYKLKQLDIQIIEKEFLNEIYLTISAEKEKLDLIKF